MNTPLGTAQTDAVPTGTARQSFWTGRSELIVVAVLYAIAILLTIGIIDMEVLGEAAPGPQFFPIVVCVLLYGSATALGIFILRNPRAPEAQDDEHLGHGDFSADMLHDLGHVEDEHKPRTETGSIAVRRPPTNQWKSYSDWRTLGMVVAGLVGFILLLNILGWIISSMLLFWTIARAMGSKRPVFDLGVALIVGSATQLAFSAGLGLSLPAGLLGGIF